MGNDFMTSSHDQPAQFPSQLSPLKLGTSWQARCEHKNHRTSYVPLVKCPNIIFYIKSLSYTNVTCDVVRLSLLQGAIAAAAKLANWEITPKGIGF